MRQCVEGKCVTGQEDGLCFSVQLVGFVLACQYHAEFKGRFLSCGSFKVW